MKKYLAEFVGAFVLSLAVVLSLAGAFPVPTPVVAALTLGLFVYTIGHVSGAHLNPAITLGALTIKKISATDALWYWVAQFIGGALAFYLADLTTARVAIVASSSWPVLFGEFIGTTFFAFGIAAVMHDKIGPAATGLVIGGSLLLGLSLAASWSSAILNPAVALAVGSLSLGYLFAPMVGAIIGMQLFKYLSDEL